MATHAASAPLRSAYPSGYFGRLVRLMLASVAAGVVILALRSGLERAVIVWPTLMYEDQTELVGSAPEVLRTLWEIAAMALVAALLVRRWVRGPDRTWLRFGPLVATLAVLFALARIGTPVDSVVIFSVPLLLAAAVLPLLPHGRAPRAPMADRRPPRHRRRAAAADRRADAAPGRRGRLRLGPVPSGGRRDDPRHHGRAA